MKEQNQNDVNSGRRATEITATSPEDYDWPV